MKTIDELWEKLKDVELVQVRPVEMEALYKHCFEFTKPLIVEIGSAHGASSIILAEAADELDGQLVCIDHFPENYYGQEKFGDYARKAFNKSMMNKNKKAVLWIAKPSADAWTDVANLRYPGDRYIDVLFVDGDHDYEAVKQDIALYEPLVRTGGYIGFHDYFNPSFGVRKAVDEMLTEWGKPAQYWDLAVYQKP